MDMFTLMLAKKSGESEKDNRIDFSDPKQVYQLIRPVDWIPIPEAQDNEIYLLFHIPKGLSSLIAFSVSCDGQYTVAIGSVNNEKFIELSSKDIVSGRKYEAELFADDYGNYTQDGIAQCMIKISGKNIKTFYPAVHTLDKSKSNWNVVELSCNLPYATEVYFGNPLNIEKSLSKLKFAKFTSNITTANRIFANCISLQLILDFQTGELTNVENMFYNCGSLLLIPSLNLSKVVFAGYMAWRCKFLNQVQNLKFESAKNISYLFAETIISSASSPEIQAPNATIASNLFEGCSSLTKIPLLSLPKVTLLTSAFDRCYSLQFLNFDPEITDWNGASFSISNCAFSKNGLVSLFKSLPRITGRASIAFSGNPGSSLLADEEKAIATEKGWTLTI